MPGWMRYLYDLVRDLVVEWQKDRVGGIAAEIAFWAVLSLFPALLVVGATLGLLDTFAGQDVSMDVENWIIEQLEGVLGLESGQTISEVEGLFAQGNAGVFTFGIVAAVYSASRAFAAIVRALDVAYDVEHPRSYIATRALGFAFALGTIVVGAVTLALLVVGPLLGRGTDLANDIGAGDWFATVWTWLRVPVAIGVLIAWATTIYHYGPRHNSPWRWDVPGAVMAAVFWLVASFGFRIYLDIAGNSNAFLGFLGGGLALLLYVYVLAIGLLVGAELNEILADRHGVGKDAPEEKTVTHWYQRIRTTLRERS